MEMGYNGRLFQKSVKVFPSANIKFGGLYREKACGHTPPIHQIQVITLKIQKYTSGQCLNFVILDAV